MAMKSKLKKRKPDHVDLTFCLDRPLAKELEQVRLEAAKAAEGRLAAGKDPRVKDLEQAVRDASVTVRVSSLPRDEYQALILAHPPREGRNEEFNPETFFEAVARESTVEVTAKSTIPIPEDDWDEFVNGLTDGEFDRLCGAVVQVNRAQGAVNLAPFV